MKTRGFTLTELLVAVAVMALLSMIAIPSFREVTRTQAIKTASFDVFSSLMLARSEAVTRNANVTITPVGGNWSDGWVIADSADEVVRRQDRMTHVVISGPNSVTYNGSGRLTTSVTSINLTSNVGGARARCISVDMSGRPVQKQQECS